MGRQSPGDGTIGKALDVLDRVAASGRPVRFMELADSCPYPRATLYRFLQALTNQGMLAFDPERQTYAPGMRLVRLAHAAWQQSSLAPIARPHIDRLSRRVGTTVHLAQIDNGHVLYVDKRNAAEPIEMFSQAGKVGPAYCTGIGKAMLAVLEPEAQERALEMQSFRRFTATTIPTREALKRELEQIRRRGHACDREEHEPGIICVAVPILTPAGRVRGGLSATSSTARSDLAALEALAPDLRRSAADNAAEAQNWRFPDGAQNAEPGRNGA